MLTEEAGMISQMWRNETPEAKSQWQERANEEARKHKLRYPNYKYKANRRREKIQTRKRPSEDIEAKPAAPTTALREYLANLDRDTLSLAL